MNISQMKFYQEQKGYSIEKLSELSGVPSEMIQKIFEGEIESPEYEVIQALEHVLNPKEEPNSFKDPAVEYQAKKKLYTLEDYYALPSDQRVELIDGVIYDMAAPNIIHQTVSMQITNKIFNFIAKKKGEYKVWSAAVDVQLDCDDKTMVQPDIIVVCDHDKITNRCIVGAPDFIIEILSPSTFKKDMVLKLAKYANAGVREYWMVDVRKGRIITYFFEEDFIPVIYGMGDTIPVRIFDGELKIDFREIQESLKGLGNLEE